MASMLSNGLQKIITTQHLLPLPRDHKRYVAKSRDVDRLNLLGPPTFLTDDKCRSRQITESGVGAQNDGPKPLTP